MYETIYDIEMFDIYQQLFIATKTVLAGNPP